VSRASARDKIAPAPRKPTAGAQKVGRRAFDRSKRRLEARDLRRVTRRHARVRRPSRWLSLRAPLGRIPAAAWLCAAVAFANAAAWSLITPPFQVPDEPAHVAYVRHLARTGQLPSASGDFSSEQQLIMEDLRANALLGNPELTAISARAQQEKLQRDLQRSERAPGAESSFAGLAASEPPLYYALQAVPYTVAGGTLLDHLELMRLTSALMGGLTALFAFLFVRETLPRVRWAWTVAGLCVALAPLLGFMSGSVNPDAMLYTVTAAMLYCLARGFRRGLSLVAALSLGTVIAVGFMTKLNFVGLAPGALMGLTVLCVRAARLVGVRAYAWLAAAGTIALSPLAVYVIAHVIASGHTLGIVSSAANGTHGSLGGELSYIWQLYLPRLPGMHPDFAGILPPRDLWFRGYVGLYGWLDTTFPHWVYEVALLPALVIVALCARSLIAGRAQLRARTVELVVYALTELGLLALVGASSYLAFPRFDAEYGQARYLLPLMPLLGVALALAARGAGRRWGPVVGVILILLFAAHDIFSQLQVLARFYG
jgi:Predicted membrane protein (DUF2142)